MMVDWLLVWPLLPLMGLSLLILGGMTLTLALTQAVFILIGLGIFFLISQYPYELYRRAWPFYGGLAGVLLGMPYWFGTMIRGSVRWLSFGFLTFQPSELVKPILIIVWAAYLSRFPRGLSIQGLWGFILLLLLPFILIYNQPDLGTALVLAVTWLGLLLSSRVNFKQLIILIVGGGIMLMPIFFLNLKPYQRERFNQFFNPYQDPAGSGYQVIQALIAVGNGGLTGQGLGQGSQSQLRFLPEKHSDFIFAAIAEEMGLVAGAGILAAYWLLLRRLSFIAKNCQDETGKLIVIGVLTMIWFQAVIAIGMNLGVMPVTGITLPLISSGGSSLLATMAALGLASSVWKFSQSGL